MERKSDPTIDNDIAVVVIGHYAPIEEVVRQRPEVADYIGPDATCIIVPREVLVPAINHAVANAAADAAAAEKT